MLSETQEDGTQVRGCRRVTYTKAASSAQEPVYARMRQEHDVPNQGRKSCNNGPCRRRNLSSDGVHLSVQETLY